MLVKLSLNTKVHILFVHMTIKVEICIVIEKSFFALLTDGLPKRTSLSLHQSEVVKFVSCTETGEDSGALFAYLNTLKDLSQTSHRFPWRLLRTSSHSQDVIFCPE